MKNVDGTHSSVLLVADNAADVLLMIWFQWPAFPDRTPEPRSTPAKHRFHAGNNRSLELCKI